MGATERIAELMKVMHEREIGEMLDFAEFLLAKRDRETTEARATLDKYAGRYDGAKWQREELYDRAGLR
ncbi:MAG: hypothetical protein IH606_03375 [Burkholderiales bacterium]|nr:hypothetical protein [Burkholderiales bacterium]